MMVQYIACKVVDVLPAVWLLLLRISKSQCGKMSCEDLLGAHLTLCVAPLSEINNTVVLFVLWFKICRAVFLILKCLIDGM